MRKSKIIPIEELGEVVIKEVSPFAVYSALSAENKTEEIIALIENCISLPREKMEKLYASEIEQIMDGFFEVNSSFLAIAEKLGIKTTLHKIASEASQSLPALFADSFKMVMDKEFGTMDGAIS